MSFSAVFVASDDVMCLDEYGFIFPPRKIYIDCVVPELFPPQYLQDDLERDFPNYSISFSSPTDRLRRYIGQYHLFGCLKPKLFPRELLISNRKRRDRCSQERSAKNFFSNCVRSVLLELSHVEIDDDVEYSVKFGELMDEVIQQVFLLNPCLQPELDREFVRKSVLRRASFVIRDYKRKYGLADYILSPEDTTGETATQNSREMEATESDDEHCQVVPEIIVKDI